MAARNRFRVKQLSYAFDEGALYFASEVRALFAAGLPARWNGESRYDAVDLGGHQTRAYSMEFLGAPGHYLVATDERIQFNRHWDFNCPRPCIPYRRQVGGKQLDAAPRVSPRGKTLSQRDNKVLHHFSSDLASY